MKKMNYKERKIVKDQLWDGKFVLFGGNNSESQIKKRDHHQHDVPAVNSESHRDYAATEVDKKRHICRWRAR